MSQSFDHDSLPEAFRPFSRLCAILDALPPGHQIADAAYLRSVIPGHWPTMGDLRALTVILRGRALLALNATAGIPDELLARWHAHALHAKFCNLEEAAERLMDEFERHVDADGTRYRNSLASYIDGPFRAALDAVRLDGK